MEKRLIFVMFDSQTQTWNIMAKDDLSCILYGTIDDVNRWLDENEGTYEEVPN